MQRIENRSSPDEHESPYEGFNALCTRCENLDIAGVRSSTQPRLTLGSMNHWQPEICTFCRFLSSLLSHQSVIDLSQPYFLFSIKTRNIPDRLFQVLDHRLIVLSTSENGPPPGDVPYLAAHSNAVPSWLKYVQPYIDFNQARQWLDVCTELHAEICSGERSEIRNLRLIDCSTGEVVKAGEHDVYVALSYVWGNEGASGQEPSGYPKTIQDAIYATQKLGYQRLWVDQYCMDQENRNDFHKQLQQMDVIYQQATVTIIAAAGTNAHYGLPGVGERTRTPTSSVSVRCENLTAIPKPDLRPETCRWISRAWTYQEGLLSTRRLVFTDDQLYFECQGCYCAEMLDIDYKKLHAPNKPWLHKRYRTTGRMGLFPLHGYGVDPWDIYCRIAEYSQRSLSYDSDILNGILGIFRAYERMENSMLHFYGVPFPRATSCPNEKKMFTNSKRSLPTFSESLRWDLITPSRRRMGFPSWSWTGWYGAIIWPAEFTDVDNIRTPGHVGRPRDPKVNARALQVCVEDCNSTMMSWEKFQDEYDRLRDSRGLSIFINIEAYVTPALYSQDGVDDRPNGVRFNLCLAGETETFYVLTTSRTTVQELLSHDTFLAIHSHRTVKGNQGQNSGAAKQVGTAIVTQHLLVVQDMGEHWERVAIGSFVVESETNVRKMWQSLRLG
jgi:hypothetical protein